MDNEYFPDLHGDELLNKILSLSPSQREKYEKYRMKDDYSVKQSLFLALSCPIEEEKK